MQHRQRRGLHQPIEPEAEEADVVAAADIVDAGISHLGQILHGGIPALVEQARRREHADPEGWRAIGLCGIRHISTLGAAGSTPQSGELPAPGGVARGQVDPDRGAHRLNYLATSQAYSETGVALAVLAPPRLGGTRGRRFRRGEFESPLTRTNNSWQAPRCRQGTRRRLPG